MGAPAFHPTSDLYERLTTFEKVEACLDHLAFWKEQPNTPEKMREVTELTKEERHWRRWCTLKDPEWDITHNMFVAREDGQIVLFHPRPGQELLQRRYNKAQEEHRPLRIILLKPRRVGGSEWAGKACYHHTFRKVGHHGLLIAQGDEEAVRIYDEKLKVTWENDPLKPKLKYNSQKFMQMEHGGSSIEIRSAESATRGAKGKGRGQMFHFLWGSEVAWWPQQVVVMMNGIMNTMPRPPFWNTAVILESTANGREGYFFDRWDEALIHERAVESGAVTPMPGIAYWESLFIPWTYLHDCFLDLAFDDGTKTQDQLDQERADARRRMKDEIYGPGGCEEEKLLLEKYDVTFEMLKWRRYIMATQIQDSDPRRKIQIFWQEYPKNADEAFTASSGQCWATELLTNARENYAKPEKWKGWLVSPFELYTKNAGRRRATPKPIFKASAHGQGNVRVWKKPKVGHRYMLACDPAQGLEMRDPSCIRVMDRDTEEIVAEWHDWKDELDLVDPVRLMSAWYNDATIIIESNRGSVLIRILREETDRLRYLFRSRDERVERKKRSGDPMEPRWGFLTTQYSKKVLVRMLGDYLVHKPWFFRDKEGLREMLDFKVVKSSDGTELLYKGVPAGSKRHDDRVVCDGMLIFGHTYTKMMGPPPVTEDMPTQFTSEKLWNLRRPHSGPSVAQREEMRGPTHPDLGDNW